MSAAKTLTGAALAIAASACFGGPTSNTASQMAQVGVLTLEVPVDWHRTDIARQGVATSTWSPALEGNERKESVTVVRIEQSRAVGKDGAPGLARLLRTAQGSLQHARTSAVTSLTTEHGLSGARIDVDYSPLDPTQTYHRVHVVLVDGTALVHVLYTARKTDPSLDTLNMVLNSIRHGEG